MRQFRYILCWAFCIYPVSLLFLVGSLYSACPSPPLLVLLILLFFYWTLRLIVPWEFFSSSLWAICQSTPRKLLSELHDSALQEEVFLCFYNQCQCYRQQTGLLYKSGHTWTGSWAQTSNPSSVKHKDSSHAQAKFPWLSRSPGFSV